MKRLCCHLAIALAAALGAAGADRPAAAETRTHESSIGPLAVTKVADGFANPWAVAFLPSGAFLVTERPGRLRLVSAAGAISAPIAGLPEIAARGQGGLLDVALAPDFASSGVIFLSFSEPAGSGARTAVVRARLDRSGAAPRLADVRFIFRMTPATSGGRHFGSRIVVARDGALFVTTGDRGQRPTAQELDMHMGKVVRISPEGGAPADNPFVSTAGALPEIWSFGHRNPQGAALDPATGRLWVVEHGAAGGDEINQPEAGKNYGWPVISYGTHYSGAKIGVGVSAPGMEQPAFYWDPSIAPSGMAIYAGDEFPEWRGDIFVGALKFRLISRVDRDASGAITGREERLLAGDYGRIRDVRVGPEGALWFLTDSSSGGLYRVTKAR